MPSRPFAFSTIICAAAPTSIASVSGISATCADRTRLNSSRSAGVILDQIAAIFAAGPAAVAGAMASAPNVAAAIRSHFGMSATE